ICGHVAGVPRLEGGSNDLHVLPRHRLLREAGGFEGLDSLGKDLELRRLPITHRPKVCGPSLDERAASDRPGALQEVHDYPSLALEERFRLDTHRVEGAEEF